MNSLFFWIVVNESLVTSNGWKSCLLTSCSSNYIILIILFLFNFCLMIFKTIMTLICSNRKKNNDHFSERLNEKSSSPQWLPMPYISYSGGTQKAIVESDIVCSMQVTTTLEMCNAIHIYICNILLLSCMDFG